MSVPVIQFDPARTDYFYHVRLALEAHERAHPALARNPHWAELKQQAKDQFSAEFKAVMG